MADGGLSPSEQAVVAEHALTCARCRELIAAIIRTTPEPPVRRAWWQMPSLRWLAPALATGLAVAVWVAVGDRQPNVTPVAVPTSAPAQSPTATLEKREIPAAPALQERDEKADAEPARKAPSELKDNAATREGAKEKVRERSKSGARSGSSRCREAEGRAARQEGLRASSGAAACCSATRGRNARASCCAHAERCGRRRTGRRCGRTGTTGQRRDKRKRSAPGRRSATPQKRWQCRSLTSLHRTRARAGESAALRCNARPTTVTRGRLRTQARPFGSRRAPRPTPPSAGSLAPRAPSW